MRVNLGRFFTCFVFLLPLQASAQEVERVTAERDLQNRWEYDPDVGTIWSVSQEPVASSLDLESLSSSDLQRRLEAMQMAIRAVAAEGVVNRREAYDTVMQQLQQDLSADAGRYSLLTEVSAAAELAADREQIEQLWQAVAERPELRHVVEPKMVEWESPLALPVWRSRLSEGQADFALQMLAFDGISQLGDASDNEVLRQLVERGDTPQPIRLLASEALGGLSDAGLEELAQQSIDSGQPQGFQRAANLLRNHTSSEANQILERILKDGDSYAQAVAFQGLAKTNPSRARALAQSLVEHPDDNIRLAAIEVLSLVDDAASLNLQASALDDANLQIRQEVRRNLKRRATQAEFSAIVNDVLSHFLAADVWQGNEQAILLAAELKKSDRADAIIALLGHPKPEVSIRAAWALQHLELTTEQLESVFQICQTVTQRLTEQKFVSFEEEIQTAFLFEALGVHAYRPASEMLELYIPKNQQIMKPVTRTSAIYALGHIWADSENPSLVESLVQRVNDGNPLDPEQVTVKYAAAIALGRMGAKSKLRDVETMPERPPNALGFARQWAVEQLGGQP